MKYSSGKYVLDTYEDEQVYYKRKSDETNSIAEWGGTTIYLESGKEFPKTIVGPSFWDSPEIVIPWVNSDLYLDKCNKCDINNYIMLPNGVKACNGDIVKFNTVKYQLYSPYSSYTSSYKTVDYKLIRYAFLVEAIGFSNIKEAKDFIDSLKRHATITKIYMITDNSIVKDICISGEKVSPEEGYKHMDVYDREMWRNIYGVKGTPKFKDNDYKIVNDEKIKYLEYINEKGSVITL